KRGVEAEVLGIEYDPNRSARIALIKYSDGELSYILAPDGLRVGARVMSGNEAAPDLGNALPLSAIPLGTNIHNIELTPGRGGQSKSKGGGGRHHPVSPWGQLAKGFKTRTKHKPSDRFILEKRRGKKKV